MDDSDTSRDNTYTVDSNGDVEGEVVGVGIRGSGGTENASGAKSGVNELNLTEETNGACGAGKGSANGLAHVTEDNISTRTSVGGGNCNRKRTSSSSSHVARGIVANNVGGIRDQLKGKCGSGGDNGGSAEEVVGVINLTNETADG